MNKKIVSLLLSSILTAGILVGCGAKEMKDGSYTAEDLNYDDHGWKASVTITVSSGRISDAKFDYIAEDGTTKSGNAAYAEKMAAAVGITPDEYLSQYAKSLVEKQDHTKIDVISGATTSKNDFIALAKNAMAAAKTGNTNTTQVKLSK